MALEPKPEPGFFQSSVSTTSQKHYSEMSISELVARLRVVYQVEDFDKIEEELKNREDKVRVEIGSLKVMLELEKLNSIEIEGRLKIREEQCKKGKQAQENYELLLKSMKQSGLDMDELKKRNVALEGEVCELKKKMVEDVKCVTELRTEISKLEEEKVREKNALNMMNTELKEEIKKNLAEIERLRTENDKLTDEKLERKTAFQFLERKYGELSASVLKLEDDVKLLMSEGASDCGNTEQEPNTGVSFAVKAEEVFDDYELENDTGEPVPFTKTKETHQYVKKGYKDLASENEVIAISDDDDDDDNGVPNQGLHREKAIPQTIGENEHPQRVETFTRKPTSDNQTSSRSTSSGDLYEMDHLKRVKTSPANTYHLPDYFLVRRI
ncbi:gelsolin-related protein of 125 kDa isoform X2 [Vigna radiata var. radiata]|uniref:Gelsolin-related protein of 125 kDa isoform X2 n=1 Tax=Vigna radiata var. radiata TaxID=3916 RepID=A0A1S3UD63_VIGRR|nr:gelsolin-related protein of 125 kDa isoform X2 [Vigna radiata var. radiata]